MKMLFQILLQPVKVKGKFVQYFDLRQRPDLIPAWRRKILSAIHPDKNPLIENSSDFNKYLDQLLNLMRNSDEDEFFVRKTTPDSLSHRYSASEKRNDTIYERNVTFSASVYNLELSNENKKLIKCLFDLNDEDLNAVNARFELLMMNTLECMFNVEKDIDQWGRLFGGKSYFYNQSLLKEFKILVENNFSEKLDALSSEKINYDFFDPSVRRHSELWIDCVNTFLKSSEVRYHLFLVVLNLATEQKAQQKKLENDFFSTALVYLIHLPATLLAWTSILAFFAPLIYVIASIEAAPVVSLFLPMMLIAIVLSMFGVLIGLACFHESIANNMLTPYFDACASLVERLTGKHFYQLEILSHLHAIESERKEFTFTNTAFSMFQEVTDNDVQEVSNAKAPGLVSHVTDID